MDNVILSILSVICFCFCAHFFTRAVVNPLPRLNETGYTRAALRLKKAYQVFSLGLMTFVFLIGLVISFSQVFIEL
jgi:hypothetical protein